MLVSTTHADRAKKTARERAKEREHARERAKEREHCDLVVYGVAATVSEFEVRNILEVERCKVVSIFICNGSAIVKFKERGMAARFYSHWHENEHTLTLCGRRIRLHIVNQHVREAVGAFLSHDQRPLHMTTVTTVVDGTYPETGDVQFEVDAEDATLLVHNSFDNALKELRKDILRKRTED